MILDHALDYGPGLVHDQAKSTPRVEERESVTTCVFIDATLT